MRLAEPVSKTVMCFDLKSCIFDGRASTRQTVGRPPHAPRETSLRRRVARWENGLLDYVFILRIFALLIRKEIDILDMLKGGLVW